MYGQSTHRNEDLGRVHLSAHTEHLGGFLADQQVITGDHLDLNAL
jgi:hypothetical protein